MLRLVRALCSLIEPAPSECDRPVANVWQSRSDTLPPPLETARCGLRKLRSIDTFAYVFTREKSVPTMLTAFALLIVATAQLTACLVECDRTLVSEVEAPGGQYAAVVQDSDCGATGASRVVQLTSIDEDGELLGGRTVFSLRGLPGEAVAVRWESDTELFITVASEREPGVAFRNLEMGDGTEIVIDYNRHWPGVPDNRPIPSYPPIDSDEPD